MLSFQLSRSSSLNSVEDIQIITEATPSLVADQWSEAEAGATSTARESYQQPQVRIEVTGGVPYSSSEHSPLEPGA